MQQGTFSHFVCAPMFTKQREMSPIISPPQSIDMAEDNRKIELLCNLFNSLKSSGRLVQKRNKKIGCLAVGRLVGQKHACMRNIPIFHNFPQRLLHGYHGSSKTTSHRVVNTFK